MSDVLVLGYHGVSPTWPASTAVRPDQLEAQLKALLRRGYRGATFSEALTSPREGGRTVAITFDDAHRSVLTLAFPLMSELGFPGTVFVPTAFPDSGGLMDWEGMHEWIGGPHERELVCMSWPELRSLSDAGWEIGSHTRSHPHLTRIGPAELAVELAESRADIEMHLETECTAIAYPYGASDARVAGAAWDAGYRLGAAMSDRYAAPLPMQWPRIPVGHDGVGRFKRRTSITTRRLGQGRTGQLLLAGTRGAKSLGRSVARRLS